MTSADASEEGRGVPLSPNSKGKSASQPPGQSPDQQYDVTAYGQHLFRRAGTVGKPAWSDSIEGRAAIRLVSRGLVGSLCFTAGGRFARGQMVDYHPELFRWEGAKPLQRIAYVFDVTFGRAIGEMTRAVGHLRGLNPAEIETSVWNATNFRPKAYYHGLDGRMLPDGRAMNGRSLGSEMVNISFDFAMASIGDSSTRNFFQMIDPNIRKSWWINNQGEPAKDGEKGHFDAGKFLQSTARSAWRVISKNQGEDWAVALPYVYQMKFQRQLLSRGAGGKGAKLVFDNTLNGAAYRVNNEGKIIGDYNLIGAADLHLRFVGYNVYTLMFREAYDKIGLSLSQWKEEGFPLHVSLPKHPLEAAATFAKDAVRYVAKSTIKANLYMNPAVIPFWMMRVPQSKWRGALVNPEAGLGENAIASTISFDDRVAYARSRWQNERGIHFDDAKMRERMVMPDGTRNHNPAKLRYFPGSPSPETVYFGNQLVKNPFHGKQGAYDPALYQEYDTSTGFGKISKAFSQTLNPIGRFADWAGRKAGRAADHLPEGSIKRFLSQDDAGNHSDAARHAFMHSFMDASLAYTPYMFAKAEFGMRVDDRPSNGQPGKMDKAIYRLIDNVCAFNVSGVRQSAKEIWQLSSDLDRPLKPREGKVVDDKPEPPAPAVEPPDPNPAPETKIIADGRTHEAPRPPVVLPPASQPESDHEQRWAEAMLGRPLDGQFYAPSSPTRH